MGKSFGETREEREAFIQENDGIFTGITSEGESAIVCVEQGVGMIVQVRHKNKPRWFECVEYDEHGFQIGLTYEPAQ